MIPMRRRPAPSVREMAGGPVPYTVPAPGSRPTAAEEAPGGDVGAEEYAGRMGLQADTTISNEPTLAYRTEAGEAWLGDAIETLEMRVEDESVDLIVTSPPFALQRPKEYGNESQEGYKTWFLPFADEFWRVLKPTGSLVLDLGGAWESGRAVKSIYAFELLITLCRRPNRPFVLAQDLLLVQPRTTSESRTMGDSRARTSQGFSQLPVVAGEGREPEGRQRRVLQEYTGAMKRLIESGTYNRGRRPSGHVIREGFTEDRGGAIPPNLLAISNTGNDRGYLGGCRELGVKAHPARFPAELPDFFINLLTEAGDLVLDPFAGSNVTGAVAESLGRRWLSVDIDEEYLRGSIARFENTEMQPPTMAKVTGGK